MTRLSAGFCQRLGYFTMIFATTAIAGWSTCVAANAAPAPQPSPMSAPAPEASPDASPGPAASPPGPQPAGRGGAAPTTAVSQPAGAKFGHLPIIDIVPVFTQPQFYTTGPLKTNGQPTVDPLKNNGTGYDPIDVGGTVKIPITPIFSASFDRVVGGTLDVPNARVTTAVNTKGQQPYQYNVFSRDVVLTTRLDEQFHGITIEQGLYFRHRIVGGAATSNNPLLPTINSTEAHFAYAGLTYATPGIRWLNKSFFTFNINADAQSIDHHVTCLRAEFEGVAATCPKGNLTGTIDENPTQNRIWETDQYVQLTVPVDSKHGVTAVAQDRWGALNFYENAPFPYRYTTSQTYLLTKRFNRVFALSLRARDQFTVPLGYPYVKPNAQHNGTVDVLADFKLDTNALH